MDHPIEIIDVDKAYREKAIREQHKNATNYIEQILKETSNESVAVRLPTYHF